MRISGAAAGSVDGGVSRPLSLWPKCRQAQEMSVVLGEPQIDAELLRKVQSGRDGAIGNAAQHDRGCRDDGDEKFPRSR
jgi:hypothetical protein